MVLLLTTASSWVQGLQMLQQHALEKLAARDKFKESGVATLKLRVAKQVSRKKRDIILERCHESSVFSCGVGRRQWTSR